jgi:general secretion pathway protein B
MSFILDALKKSEIERQRQSVPGLMDARTPPVRKRFPAWAMALGALLAVNLIVLGVVLMRNNAATAPHMAGAGSDAGAAGADGAGAEGKPARSGGAPGGNLHAHAAAGDPGAGQPGAGQPGAGQPGAGDWAVGGTAAAAAPFSPLDSGAGQPGAGAQGSAEYAPEIPVEQPAEASAAARAARQTNPSRAEAGARVDRRADPRLSDAEPEDQEVLPSISELDLASQGLAELHIDVHVFATNPPDRFVYINMHKYHEGATLQEGPKLERIRRDGVVLSYRGVRFFLPRQS